LTGTPSDSLFQEIEFVDNSIGLMVKELKKKRLYDSTLIIIPPPSMDSRRSIPRRSCAFPAHNGGVSRSTIISALLPDSEVNQIRRGTLL
jgi:hypothetical protein